ncbi:MAG: S8 family serine peptidase [Methylobacter sp.]|nr:S8 family serine peptidase [Methylobacter sp.]
MNMKFFLCVSLTIFVYVQCIEAVHADEFTPYAHKMPSDLPNDVDLEKSTRVIVRYYDAAIETEINSLESSPQNDKPHKARILDIKAQRYGELKSRSTPKMDKSRYKIERDYSHLPMNVITIKGRTGLLQLLADPTVGEVYRDRQLHHNLIQSAPLIKSPEAYTQTGFNGSNTMVVILDTGVNYTLSDFGSCTAPGVPASCRVKVAQDFAVQDNALDADGHGTNVSGVVASIARGTQLAVFDVFDGLGASDSVILQGFNWALANQLTYNIASISMSLGDGIKNTTQCSSTSSNPYVVAIANAYTQGILTVIASGNENFTNGISGPACTPKAVSVGAVYDSNMGARNWGIGCNDTTTAADKVTCFSNSASYLSVLAPGSEITAAGITMSGTSQATPHVAAAVAILHGARPLDLPASTLSRLTTTGVSVTDTRNNKVFPRINVLAALGSIIATNDSLTNNTVLLGTIKQTITTVNATTTNQSATKEVGEPNHAGNAGGKSVWFEWTAPATGYVSIDTHRSNFDTLLAVYTGSTMSTLVAVAINDDDGSDNRTSGVSFKALAGTVYKIAVDGYNGVFGNVELNLLFDTSASAVTMINTVDTSRGYRPRN